jgi:hypothetical protein
MRSPRQGFNWHVVDSQVDVEVGIAFVAKVGDDVEFWVGDNVRTDVKDHVIVRIGVDFQVGVEVRVDVEVGMGAEIPVGV